MCLFIGTYCNLKLYSHFLINSFNEMECNYIIIPNILTLACLRCPVILLQNPIDSRMDQIVQPKSMMLPLCGGLTFVFQTNFRLQDSCNLLCFIYLSCCHFRRLNIPEARREVEGGWEIIVHVLFAADRDSGEETLTSLSAYSAISKKKRTVLLYWSAIKNMTESWINEHLKRNFKSHSNLWEN